jgi:hypothetical protein
MRRVLTWVILALPLAACIFLWLDSYWHYNFIRWERHWRHVEVRVDKGIAWFYSMTGREMRQEGWRFGHGKAYGRPWAPDFLGFGYESGYESDDRNGYAVYQVPIWSIALLTSFPPLWFFRRQRKHSKIGFPVSPTVEQN